MTEPKVSGEREGRLLAEPNFRRWYLARSVSLAGTAVSGVALPVLVYATSGSATLTAAIVGLEALPYLLFGLLFGALADRRPRRRMMVQADIIATLALATVPLAALGGWLTAWQVLVVAFGVGVCFCWFDAAAWGALPQLIGKARLAPANSMIHATAVVTGIAAPAGAGLVLVVVSPAYLLTFDALTYLGSALLLWRIRTNLDPAATDAKPSIGRDIRAGLTFIWRQPTIRTLTLTGFGFSTADGGMLALIVVHADRALSIHSGDGRIGLVYAATAVGSLVAAWLLPRAARALGEGTVSVTSYALFTATAIGLATVAHPWLGLALWAVWDFANTGAIVNAITVRQHLAPDDLQGRVNTTGRMIAWGGTPFGALLGGLAAENLDVRWAFLLLTIPVVIGLLVLIWSPVRRLRLTEPAEAATSSTASA